MMNLKQEQLTIEEQINEMEDGLDFYEYVLENHEALEIEFDTIESYPDIIENAKAEILDMYILKGNEVKLEIDSYIDEYDVDADRYLMLELIAEGSDAERVFELASNLFKQELNERIYTMDADFSSFPVTEENLYSDIMDIPFEYGNMGNIRKMAKESIRAIA